MAGTVEFLGVDGMPDERRVDQATFNARLPFRALTQAPHSTRTGQHSSTPDSLSAIAGMTNKPGPWLCFACGIPGMMVARPRVYLTAEPIIGDRTFIDPAPYSQSKLFRPTSTLGRMLIMSFFRPPSMLGTLPSTYYSPSTPCGGFPCRWYPTWFSEDSTSQTPMRLLFGMTVLTVR